MRHMAQRSFGELQFGAIWRNGRWWQRWDSKNSCELPTAEREYTEYAELEPDVDSDWSCNEAQEQLYNLRRLPRVDYHVLHRNGRSVTQFTDIPTLPERKNTMEEILARMVELQQQMAEMMLAQQCQPRGNGAPPRVEA